MKPLLGGLLALLGLGAAASSSGPSEPGPASPGGSGIAPGDLGALDPLFRRFGDRWGVPWLHLKAFAMTEAWDGNVGRWADSVMRGYRNPADVAGSASGDKKSWGFMQMTIPTAQDYDEHASPELLNRPEYSIDLAAQHVRQLMRIFPIVMEPWIRLEAIAKAYNQGARRTQAELAGGPGYANEYWARFKRNLQRIGGGP